MSCYLMTEKSINLYHVLLKNRLNTNTALTVGSLSFFLFAVHSFFFWALISLMAA